MWKSRLLFLLIAIVVVVLVWATVQFGGRTATEHPDVVVWTCSMHPLVRMDRSGQCPICGMDLIPVRRTDELLAMPHDDTAPDVEHHIALSPHARQMARVETVQIEPRELQKEIRTVGQVQFDETTMAYITARIDGRVDEVFANFPGTVVRRGDHLVSIYSPDLLATQSEFLSSYRLQQARQAGPGDRFPALADSARRRLELWGITAEQIEDLIRTGEPRTHLTIYAPIGGTVVEKDIRAGQFVREGDSLFTIGDLSHVWLVLQIYETELAWIRIGQAVSVLLDSRPEEPFQGTVGFIEPVLDETTRSVPVRVILRNDENIFKPGMYAQALIQVAVMPDGTAAPTGVEGRLICPMHPYIVRDEPDNCPVCGMPLELVPGQRHEVHDDSPAVLAVPASAVLTTGRRQLVYVEREPGIYFAVEPILGARAGDYYPVLGGLKPGDRVVVRGNFLLDSQFQISGHPSLLYPEGITGGGVGHAGHGGINQPTESPGAAPSASDRHVH